MAKKWNRLLHRYEPYTIPEGWKCPLVSMDMDLPINCASCGKAIRFGEGFTSHVIHSDMGMGYSVCEECHEKEWAAEMSARKENVG